MLAAAASCTTAAAGTAHAGEGCGTRPRPIRAAYCRSHPASGRNPRREQFGERPDAAQQREGGLRGDFGIEKPVAPEGELPGRKARRIGDVQRGKAQAADILPPEVFGEIVIGGLGTRQRAERRQAHAVVQAAGCAVEAHRIGNGAVALAAECPEQRRHAGGEIHRKVICGAAGRR